MNTEILGVIAQIVLTGHTRLPHREIHFKGFQR